MGVGKLIFYQSFLLCFVLNVDMLWMLAPYGKNNMYLGKIFIYSCIVLHTCVVCALQVFDKMPKWYFLVILDSNKYQFLGIIIIIHVYHVLIIGCMVYTLCPMSACSCIGHASHMHTRCTIDAHTLSIHMFCIHSC